MLLRLLTLRSLKIRARCSGSTDHYHPVRTHETTAACSVPCLARRSILRPQKTGLGYTVVCGVFIYSTQSPQLCWISMGRQVCASFGFSQTRLNVSQISFSHRPCAWIKAGAVSTFGEAGCELRVYESADGLASIHGKYCIHGVVLQY